MGEGESKQEWPDSKKLPIPVSFGFKDPFAFQQFAIIVQFWTYFYEMWWYYKNHTQIYKRIQEKWPGTEVMAKKSKNIVWIKGKWGMSV